MVGKPSSVLLCALLSVIALPVLSQAQKSAPDEQAGFAGAPAVKHGAGLDIRVTVHSVLLNVAVRDRHSNRSIKDLQLGDFRVYENGVSQQLQQADITDAPFSVLLLMDVSGSTYTYTKMMRKAANEFLEEIGPNDRVAVAAFNSKVRLLQDYTSDLHAVSKAIGRLHSDGGTAFYDALMTGVDRYASREEGRKAIVVFTDGVDNALEGNPREGSRTSYQELFNRLSESDALIYTIFLDSEGKQIAPASRPASEPPGGKRPKFGPFSLPLPRPSQSQFPLPFPKPVTSPIPKAPKPPKPDDDETKAYRTAYAQLGEIAEMTGGRMYAPHRLEDLSCVYREIADDLRLQYLLSYASTNESQGEGWRSIRVEVTQHPEAVVRTRRGYAVSHGPK